MKSAQPRNPATYDRYALCFLAALLLAVAGTAVAQDNFWLGASEGGDGTYWTNAANWSLGVPTSAHRVVLGNNPASEQTQTIILTEDATVDKIQFTATEARHYVLQAEYNETLERDARLTILQSTDQLIIEASATADFTLDLYVHGCHPDVTGAAGNSRFYNNSSTSRLVIGPSGVWDAANDAMPYETGTFILQGQIVSPLRPLTGGPATLILDSSFDPVIGAMNPNVRINIYLAQDASIGGLWRGAGDLYFGTHGVDSPDRAIEADGGIRYFRSSDLFIVDNPIDASGNLTLKIGYWDNASTWHAGEIVTIPGSTVEIGSGTVRRMDGGAVPGVSGGGNLHLLSSDDSHVFSMRRAVEHTGRTMIETGILAMASGSYVSGGETYTSHGILSPDSIVEIGVSGKLRLAGFDQTIAGLTGFRGKNLDQTETCGEVELGGAALTIDAQTPTSFAGTISGTGAVVKAGSATFTLAGGYTNVTDRTLRIADGLLEITGALNVEQGVFELAGGRIAADSLASEDAVWNITLHEANEGQTLVTVGQDADISGATLDLVLAAGYVPEYGREYILLYAGSITGAEEGGLLFGIQDGDSFIENGQEYMIRWQNGSEQIILTAIPEPGSLILLLLAAGGLLLRRRL